MSENNGSSDPKPTVEELRAEIKQTRAELGETVQALAAKADVKARAKEQVEQTKLKVKAQAAEATERVRGVAAAAAGAVSGKVHEVADQATEKVNQNSTSDLAVQAREQIRNSPVPISLVFAGAVAIVGIILIVRGSRR
ncbi:hypothetical protein Aab01nite_28720 [Paractinoplanes abujensis]|uniref:ABC-type transporter Mla subunit MlaD n=1 Tax=Paractinoplanes abujensis TaxID=882441 RepID=A0A7W7D0X9_9ACTN|nr:DUF3618 domain-containing protein [Actinoplanes abujensis]MBB4698232.1 ABC-type transporter Mla subunit MlaD [Actinoplanes abujensis]GID19282.1 hypothetical protein Aab01nite_28720 [Actinoplanes abujensis]